MGGFVNIWKLCDLEIKGDARGSLIAIEQWRNVPFEFKRAYYIFNTKAGVRRGCHAHKQLSQMIICLSGSCKLSLEDGQLREEIILASPTSALMIQGLVWRELYDFSPDCVLLVLADQYYNENDYIRDYDEFSKLALEITEGG